MKNFRAAIVEMDIKVGDKEANLDALKVIIDESSRQEADLVCLPEYVLTGSCMDILKDVSEPIDGPSVHALGRIAEEYGVHIMFSMAENQSGDIYNTGVLLGPRGDVLGAHRKMHLFLEEKNFVKTGDEYVVVDTALGRLGLMVCYDAVFPELSRKLALMGAEVLLLPANWPDPFRMQWNLATCSRALDNQVWMIASNRIGSLEPYSYFGDSRIVDPYGNVAVRIDGGGIGVADITDSAGKEFRGIVDFIGDRKKNYGL